MQRRRLLACATTAALPFWSPTAAAESGRWILATGYSADGLHARNLQQLSDDLRAATRGAFSLDVRPDNRLMPLADIPQAVVTGRIPAGEAILSGLAARWPVAGADTLPFVTSSYDDAHRLWLHQRPVLAKALAPSGLEILLAVPWPPQGLYSTKPLAGLEDLRGSRMRTYSPATRRLAELLGAQAVELSVADIPQALTKGQVDAMITSAITGVEQQMWQWTRYYYDINAWLPKNLVMVNTKALADLPADHRNALLRLAEQAEVRGWDLSRRASQQALATLRSRRVQVESTPVSMLTPLRRLGERFSREWVHEVGADANAIFIPYYTHNLQAASA